ncbi:Nebulette, partial [Plecturocebus cupreus]
MRVPVTEDVKDETEEEKLGEEENEEDQVFYKPVIEDLRMELARKCTELISDSAGNTGVSNRADPASFFVDERDGFVDFSSRCGLYYFLDVFQPSYVLNDQDGIIRTVQRGTDLDGLDQIHYKEEFKKSKDKCTFVTDTPMLNHVKNIGAFISEAKYKGTIKADLSNSLYKRMPATIDSVFAREVTQLQIETESRHVGQAGLDLLTSGSLPTSASQSAGITGDLAVSPRLEIAVPHCSLDLLGSRSPLASASHVAYKQKHGAAKGVSDYTHMKEPPEVKHAMEVNKHQSN